MGESGSDVGVREAILASGNVDEGRNNIRCAPPLASLIRWLVFKCTAHHQALL